MERKSNFNAGPATLPLPVLEKIQAEMIDFRGAGMSILEMSHRSKEFTAVLDNTKASLREVMDIPSDYEILFLGGGASQQFAMIPMNFLQTGQKADYISTGSWSQKAIKEAKAFGDIQVVGSSEDQNFSFIPQNLEFSPGAQYVHLTSNNTIFGTQWKNYPETKNIPLFADLSSDILCRKTDVSQFSLIYAGAQKNAGPAGVTIIIARREFLEKDKNDIPIIFRYKTHLEKDSCYNTPPVFQIYVVGLVLEWIKEFGGLLKMGEHNQRKADLLYNTIDENPGFYKGTAEKESRSLMNATFRLPSEDLESKFISEASSLNLHGLKGHRSAGGIRASMYNALPFEAVEKLTSFMKDFAQKNS